VPVTRGKTAVGETERRVSGKQGRCLIVTSPGWRDFFVSPESDIDEWSRALTSLEPPPNAAELRRNTIGSRPVASVVLTSEDKRGAPTAASATELFALSPDGTLLNGVTLDGVKELRDLVLRHNSSSNADDQIVKTADVAVKIVKPTTAALPQGQQAYVDLDDGKHRGKPNHFVSHTWQAGAMGLLNAIIEHGDRVVGEGNKPHPVYYLDLASVDQHKTDQVSFTLRATKCHNREWG
jgi:hypothetical protein